MSADSALEVPTTGVEFNTRQIQAILASIVPPLTLQSYEATELGYNNRVHFLKTQNGLDLVLKAGGRYWKRQKTEAEVAGVLTVRKLCSEHIRVPRILGFSSRKGSELGGTPIPWEWILSERIHGASLNDAWAGLDDQQKVVVAEKLVSIIIHMRTDITLQSLGLDQQDTACYGNLSLTPPDLNITWPGHDHLSFRFDDPSMKSNIYISNILNGPPPSRTYLQYVHSLLEAEINQLELQENRSKFANTLTEQRLPRLRSLLGRIHEHPALLHLEKSGNWQPVFTHGDFQPPNIFISPPKSEKDDQVDLTILDWEWSGFFPPHIEWDAGIYNLVDFFGDSPARAAFTATLDTAGIKSPGTIPQGEWESAVKITRLTECVVPWWLGGYPDDGGEGPTRKILEEKRMEAVLELDGLLSFFDA
ncbi:hypothetical protein BD410DRAFT_8510 [Rickenella mellea]|uniref:Aminoglycoside phosphotransferase domain-containing protein n=1 Tax=Rickenella mellea TaxID=50990 RepID=A0A4V3AZH9_9AGAM|nr:hypothetical protein BD410DRAFT_8510 [Rickenella mellea]